MGLAVSYRDAPGYELWLILHHSADECLVIRASNEGIFSPKLPHALPPTFKPWTVVVINEAIQSNYCSMKEEAEMVIKQQESNRCLKTDGVSLIHFKDIKGKTKSITISSSTAHFCTPCAATWKNVCLGRAGKCFCSACWDLRRMW